LQSAAEDQDDEPEPDLGHEFRMKKFKRHFHRPPTPYEAAMTAIVSPPSAGPQRSARGFTLIELMITVAIIAILATVAMPSYQSYIRKGNRADATSLLQAASLAQERHRLGNTTYAGATTALSPPCPTTGTCSSERLHYTLGVSGNTGSAYTLTATAASSIQQGDAGCTTITLAVTGGNSSFTPATCWSK